MKFMSHNLLDTLKEADSDDAMLTIAKEIAKSPSYVSVKGEDLEGPQGSVGVLCSDGSILLMTADGRARAFNPEVGALFARVLVDKYGALAARPEGATIH